MYVCVCVHINSERFHFFFFFLALSPIECICLSVCSRLSLTSSTSAMTLVFFLLGMMIEGGTLVVGYPFSSRCNTRGWGFVARWPYCRILNACARVGMHFILIFAHTFPYTVFFCCCLISLNFILAHPSSPFSPCVTSIPLAHR